MHVEFEQFIDEEGKLNFSKEETLITYVERNVTDSAQTLAYRYIDYSRERDGEAHELTWEQFGVKLRALAARLQQVTKPGDRVAILASQSLDYVVGFFGSIYAGNVAVPLYAPDDPYPTERLHAVLGDCQATTVLTTTRSAEAVREFFASTPAKDRPRVIAIDAIPDAVGETFVRPNPRPEDVAYLQYTSGSTRVPAGVEITFQSVAANVMQMAEAIQLDRSSRGVTWLPMFHDMGLLTVILPAVGGRYITIMNPQAFVRRPGRWIKELAAESDGAETFAAAPNFAFEHAALRGLPKDGESLDLSNVIGLINGSEPVTVSSMRKFNDAFGPYGLPKTAIKPCYGMAEATLFVSATPRENEAKIIYVDRTELNKGQFKVVDSDDPNAVAQVSCGKVSISQWATIVDSETGTEMPDGHVGEIWLHGLNMGIGYYGRPEESEKTFRNKLINRLPEGSHAEGVAEDGIWMSTGDFGVYFEGDLYITGRVKDLIIVDGRNHYPQDIEATAHEATPLVRTGFVAAFSVPSNELPKEVFEQNKTGLVYDPDDASEQLVVVAERASSKKGNPQEIADEVRAAVASIHGVMVRDLLLATAGSIPRTSSGKIARRACRAAYLDGSLRSGYQQDAYPDAPEPA